MTNSQIQLSYGNGQQFCCELSSEQIAWNHEPAPAIENISAAVAAALREPIDYPPLNRAMLSEDRIAIAVEDGMPFLPEIINELWTIFSQHEVQPGQITIIQTVGPASDLTNDPRALLPEEIRSKISWVHHETAQDGRCAYLANSSNSERLYLAKEITEADFVMTIGTIAYDALLGYRGTSSILYPGMSDQAAVDKLRGQGQPELSPDDDRAVRHLIDEVAWLLGTQFTIQLIPGSAGTISHLLAGHTDSVLRYGKELLDDCWYLEFPERVELIVITISGAAQQNWEALGNALTTARNLVEQDGRILVLSELAEDPGEGMRMIRESLESTDALAPLRKVQPEDLIPTAQLIKATDWAHVHLLSQLNSDLVEELFMIPLESEQEIQRLLQSADSCVLIESAQYSWGQIQHIEV